MPSVPKLEAIVLAGQRTKGTLAAAGPEPWEALLPIAGQPMVGYVLEALAASGVVRAVHVVGPDWERRAPLDSDCPVTVLAPRDTLWENLDIGLAALASSDPALVVTGDIPLLAPATVREFAEAAAAADAAAGGVDIVYPLIPRAIVEQEYPEVHRTYFRLQEGVFTGGNLFWVRPAALTALRAHAERLLAHRKSPGKLAGDIGWGVLVRYLLRRLKLAEVERVAGRLLAVRGVGLVFPHADAGVDVDKLSDLELVRRHVAAKAPVLPHA